MNFKPWQIFFFSLVPLALVFAGVIAGSFHGKDSAKEVFPTSSAPSPGTGGPQATAAPGTTTLTISAQNLKFDKTSLRAPPNTQVTVQFTNNDAGVSHNFAVYRNRQANQPLTSTSVGQLFVGVATQSVTFTTPGPGNYFFRCDVHPDTMTGSFIVQ